MENTKKITAEQFIEYAKRHGLTLEIGICAEDEVVQALVPGTYYLVALVLRKDGTVWRPDWSSEDEGSIQVDPDEFLSGEQVHEE
jgi:hypothetical protein